ncbi:hypothetical protein MRB53_016639 [Persea americana]|uniref:Uncharacterized protein n=1 Tax=Persea americana TaxID=3435 RepID=A0ACC2M2V7_PERAE|nr:hypothetical protein MRB53_016639 [Persea americana]
MDANLMALRMRQNENVTQFAKRFWTVYSQIEGAFDEMAVKSFQHALLPGIELWKDLVWFPVVTMKALMAQANQFIIAEEDEVQGRENFGLYQDDKPSKKDKDPPGGRSRIDTGHCQPRPRLQSRLRGVARSSGWKPPPTEL